MLATAPHDKKVSVDLERATVRYQRRIRVVARHLLTLHAVMDGIDEEHAIEILWFYFGFTACMSKMAGTTTKQNSGCSNLLHKYCYKSVFMEAYLLPKLPDLHSDDSGGPDSLRNSRATGRSPELIYDCGSRLNFWAGVLLPNH